MKNAKNEAWFFILLGAGLFVCAALLALDCLPGTGGHPAAESIKMGMWALLAGPILVGRGLSVLSREVRKARAAEHAAAEGLIGHAYKAGENHVALRCKACSEDYVYFPYSSRKNLNDYLATTSCLAPCPACGWIQRDMLAFARKRVPVSITWPYLVAAFLFFVAVGFFIYAVTGTPAQRTLTVWLIPAGLVLAALLFTSWGVFRALRWDPNTLPQWKRLSWAATISMPAEHYRTLVTEPEPEEIEPDPSTAIKPAEDRDILNDRFRRRPRGQ